MGLKNKNKIFKLFGLMTLQNFYNVNQKKEKHESGEIGVKVEAMDEREEYFCVNLFILKAKKN